MSSLNQWFRNLSLAKKLTAIGVATSTTAVIVACALIVAYDISSSRERLGRDVGLLAHVVGDNSTAAVAFGDASGASETLRAVSVNTHITSAAIFLLDGTLFARYDRDFDRMPAPPAVGVDVLRRQKPWHAFSGNNLLVARPITLKNDVIGMVVVESDLSEVRERTIRFGRIIALALVGAIGIALVVGWLLQRMISTPLLRLTEVTRVVTRDHRYDLRVEQRGRRRDRRAGGRVQRDARRDSGAGPEAAAAPGGARADGRDSHRGAARHEHGSRLGARQGDGSEPRQERVPRQHEPRDPHTR